MADLTKKFECMSWLAAWAATRSPGVRFKRVANEQLRNVNTIPSHSADSLSSQEYRGNVWIIAEWAERFGY